MPKQTTSGHYVAGHARGTTITSGATGNQIRRWINEKTGLETETVLSDGPSELISQRGGMYPGIYYNLGETDLIFITGYSYGLSTNQDRLTVEIGVCSAVDGGGTFIPLTSKRHIATGNPRTGYLDQDVNLAHEPIAVPYSAAARSITMRVTANDADAEVTVSWRGYRE